MTLERLAIETEQLKVIFCCHKSKVIKITGLKLLAPKHQEEWRLFLAMVYQSWKIEWL